MTMTLKDKTIFISGASRGIGLAIALRAARDGANIVVAAKNQASARTGGTRTVVNLHEKLRPPTAADSTNQWVFPLLKNSQNEKNIAVVQVRSGSSIVTSGPCASRFGLSAKSQAASTMARGPYSRRLQAAVNSRATIQTQSELIRASGSSAG